MRPSELLASNRLVELDSVQVETFNLRAKEPHRLHPELGPSAFEGDIDAARVILLLANPGYDETSTQDDHTYSREGWPLGGLHPEAPAGLRDWWTHRLRSLTDIFGKQAVSQRVACLQFCPWASGKFNDALRLPSGDEALRAAELCAQRGAVLLVMRAERHWLQSQALRDSANRFRVNSWRSSYVSPGNLSSTGWHAVVAAMSAD